RVSVAMYSVASRCTFGCTPYNHSLEDGYSRALDFYAARRRRRGVNVNVKADYRTAERSFNMRYRESSVDDASMRNGVVRGVCGAAEERDISRWAYAMLVDMRTEDELFFSE
ncbi:MAG: hypothetical protein ACE1ZA_13620, partial [Pseudomonadales bacterium]